MNNNEHKLQYYHNIGDKYTVCCEVPDKEELMLHLGMSLTFDKVIIPIKIGFAKCHPKDKYIRKLGKEVSSQNLNPCDFFLDQIRFIDNNYYVVHLCAKIQGYATMIEMEVQKNIKRVYFVDFKHFKL